MRLACASLLLQCSRDFDSQHLTYPSDRAEIAFVMNLLMNPLLPVSGLSQLI